jgi:purine nucleoside permease
MRNRSLFVSFVVGLLSLSGVLAVPLSGDYELAKKSSDNYDDKKLKPKIVIISMFDPEAAVWYGIPDFNVLAQNITVPGLSPLYPAVHCTANAEVCQLTVGESGRYRVITVLSFDE